MSQTTSVQVIKTVLQDITVATSTSSFKIVKFNDRVGTITTEKIEIPEIDAVWSITIHPTDIVCTLSRNYKNGCYFELSLQAKHEFLTSQKYWYKANLTLDTIIIDYPGNECIKEEISNYEWPVCKSYGLKPYEHCLDSDGSLSFNVTVEIYYKGTTSNRNKSHDHIAAREQAVSNLSAVFDNSLFSDFTIKVKEKEFKVHRSILATASPVFLKMFQANMQESINNRCEVDKIEPDIFEHMLRFIYGGNLPENLSEVAMDLYEAAHYYEIEGLKSICKKEVHGKLSTTNALQIYSWLQVYEIDDLKTDAWEIIKRDILKIFIPLKNEPLKPEEIQEIIQHKQNEEKFWEKFS